MNSQRSIATGTAGTDQKSDVFSVSAETRTQVNRLKVFTDLVSTYVASIQCALPECTVGLPKEEGQSDGEIRDLTENVKGIATELQRLRKLQIRAIDEDDSK